MRLLPKIIALKQRCSVSQRRCEAQLSQLAREDENLRCDQLALDTQAEGVRQLLATQRPAGTVLDRDQLYAQLRKLAVLQHKLQNLGLQVTQLKEQRQRLAERRAASQNERRIWLRKDDKYQGWVMRVRNQNRLLSLRQDEAEQEEVTQWNR